MLTTQIQNKAKMIQKTHLNKVFKTQQTPMQMMMQVQILMRIYKLLANLLRLKLEKLVKKLKQ